MSKIRVALLLVTAMLLVYGVKEIVGAMSTSSPTRGGFEALGVALVTLAFYLGATRVERGSWWGG